MPRFQQNKHRFGQYRFGVDLASTVNEVHRRMPWERDPEDEDDGIDIEVEDGDGSIVTVTMEPIEKLPWTPD